MKQFQKYSWLVLLALTMVMAGCRSSKKAAQADNETAIGQTVDGTAVTTVTSGDDAAVSYVKASKLSTQAMTKVLTNQQAARGIRAKVNVTLESGSRLSASGSLKMKRDEIIQITLTAILGIEVGRLELTPEFLLIQRTA